VPFFIPRTPPSRVSLSMLENVKIAKPCPANWDAMTGDERVRFCGQCKLHVYNLSGMTRNDAEDLLSKTEGSVCVRLYKRADGTVITRDCPVGLAALRRRVATLSASIVAALAVGWGSFFGRTEDGIDGTKVEPVRPEKHQVLMGAPMPMKVDVPETPPPEPKEEVEMGKVEVR
jgi:hypothetical protein